MPTLELPFASRSRLSDALVWIVAAAMTIFTLCWPLLHWSDPSAFDENGPVEGLQTFYLAFAVAFLLWAARNPAPLARLPLAGIALFTFNLFIRESDVRHTWAEPYLSALFVHGRMFYYLAGLWTALVAMTCVNFMPTLRDLFRWIRGVAGAAMVVGCLLYVSGDVAEKHGFFADAVQSEELEETLELYAELCGKLGDDGGLKAAYRGGCPACQNLSPRAIRHERAYQCCPPSSA